MTNPNNIVRVRARNGGRASVYEANAWAQGFSMGILEGYGVAQNTSADMNVLVGGSATKPDVLIAQNPAGYKIALDIIGRQAVAITAPASNSRISAIVAYTNDLSLSTTQDDVTGSPASCGLIVVNGTAAANPVAPTDSQIRTAITSDGATGSQAAYCVIATIQVASNTTMITNSLISTNQAAMNGGKSIIDASITANKIDFTITTDSVGWKKLPISDNVVIYLAKGESSKSMDGRTWRTEVMLDKPFDLDLSNQFFGGAGGLAGDHAINVCGGISSSTAKVTLQLQNIYEDTVSSDIYWWAYIIEILS